MSIPPNWVDRIFTKLTLVYGRDFLSRWEGVEIGSVKTDWAHELASLGDWPEAIAYGLANLPVERPPTALQFRQICRSAPPKASTALPEPAVKADPARVAAELAKLADIRIVNRVAPSTIDHKAWAKSIMAEHDAGRKLNPTRLRFAREALGIKLSAGDDEAQALRRMEAA